MNSSASEMERCCNKCGVTKLLDAFPKQKGCRNGYRASCKSCMALKTQQWREADPERNKVSLKTCKERNPDRWAEKDQARSRKYREAHPERVRAAALVLRESGRASANAAAYYEANRELIKARSKAWAKANPEKVRLNALIGANKRRAAKLRATPAWADDVKIKAIYKVCHKVCQITGRKYEVDHVIPLRGKTVCGLHVHENLRIITSTANRRKGAKLE